MSKEKLDREGVQEAVRLTRMGLNDRDIAAYIGVAPQTYSTWRNHPKTKVQQELAEALKKAEVERKGALLSRVLKATDESWQAAAWMLERRYPAEYARPDRYHDQGVTEAIQAVRELTESIKAQADAANG